MCLFFAASLPILGQSVGGGLPVFRHKSVVLDYQNLVYNPANDVIVPSVIRASEHFPKAMGRYYMYYAPHDAPGGICLAYADKPEGPWKEYASNPLIGRNWTPHHQVSHVSGPHAIWSIEEHKLFLYYHGENDTTRLASSTDGVHFQYEGVAITSSAFDSINEASYARVFRHRLPGKNNRYIMLLMGNNNGTRRIYLAWSDDGRKWEPRRTPLLDPPPGTGQVAQAWYLPWRGKEYLIYHAHTEANPIIADLHISEVDPTFEHTRHLGILYGHTSVSAANEAQMSPCFIEDGGWLYMFSNIGPRLHQKIALAAAPAAGPAPPDSYLAGVIADLQKPWPANRTINIVCHGHSVPAGYFRTPEVRSLEAYPHLLRESLSRLFPHAIVNVIVSAKGGENSAEGAARFERDVLSYRPAVVLLDYSLNDRKLGLEAAADAWASMIRTAKESGAAVVLLTPTPDLASKLNDPDDPLELHADQVRRLAGEFGVGLADSLAAFKRARSATSMTELMSQPNHPNAEGHRLVALEILRYFDPQ